MEKNAFWPILVLWIFIDKGESQCSKQDYQRCVKLADPLLKDPHLIYPDNPRDIERVCRTWTYFVECVKLYTDRCFTEARRKEFNKAVESPVSSIHKLCSSPDYRGVIEHHDQLPYPGSSRWKKERLRQSKKQIMVLEYMKHASCMKMMLTEDKHCGRHYRLLVNQVSGEAAQSSICCSHHMFRECVVDQTKSTCDEEAAPFSGQMLDKALSFLRDQCANYIPNQVDCPGLDFYKSTTTLGRSDDVGFNEMTKMKAQATTQSHVTPKPETSGTSQTQTKITNPWTPATDPRAPTGTSSTKVAWTSSSVAWTPSVASETETSRSSYARGIIYSVSTTEGPPTWKVSGSYQNTWLPSPRPIDNAIDEPNQQGLGSGADNSAVLAALSTGLILLPLLQPFILR